MEAATTKMAEVTAVGASAMMTTIAVTAKGMGAKTRLAEARGTESPHTVLRHLRPVKAEVVAEAGGQGLAPPMAEKRSRTHETG